VPLFSLTKGNAMIIPLPAETGRLPGFFPVGTEFRLVAGPEADGAASLLAGYLRTRRGAARSGTAPAGAGNQVELRVEPSRAARDDLGEEGYELRVTQTSVLLAAGRPAGLLHGVQTLRQLLPPETAEPGCPADFWRWPCLHITDRPRLPWRGVMLDVARHHLPLDYLYRFTDLLALHKLNVLHLHLTDDQGWRIEIDGWPRLTEVGAWRTESPLGFHDSGHCDGIPHGGYYTADQLRGLVRYAAARGIALVPEIEMPGHARAALAAYPELGNHPDRPLPVWTGWGISEDTFGVHDRVLDFCRDVLEQVLEIFPSHFIHIGGDECPTDQWEASPAARLRAAEAGLAGPHLLRGWFLGQISEFLAARGRRAVCWEDAGLPPQVVVAAWQDPADGIAALKLGHPVIMAPARWTFLDYPQSEDPREPLGQPDHTTSLRDVYEFDPLAGGLDALDILSVADSGGPGVLGAQAQLWTEYAPSTAHVSYLAFPRLSAFAEMTWSATGRDFASFQKRLLPQLRRLELLGVQLTRPAGFGIGAAAGAATWEGDGA
jgi:hexosaminidase